MGTLIDMSHALANVAMEEVSAGSVWSVQRGRKCTMKYSGYTFEIWARRGGD